MTNKKQKPFTERIASAFSGNGSPTLDADLIREMAKLLDETGLNEIEVESGGARVRVARGAMMSGAMIPAATTQTGQSATESRPPEPPPKRGTLITSPMVGTVYLSSQPGAAPFVKVGDKVTDGTVCIVEAMKTMNPVLATAAGHVAEIFVRDGQPVEFGEPLMRIE